VVETGGGLGAYGLEQRIAIRGALAKKGAVHAPLDVIGKPHGSALKR